MPSCGTSGNGSSPLARGLLIVVVVIDDLLGIIPARAGFTCPSAGRARHERDHPRSRGVYATSHAHEQLLEGSSPLARGLLPLPARRMISERIIPARAGFTLAFG